MRSKRQADMQDYLQVGVLTKPHGVRGAVKVFPTTDDRTRFKKGLTFYLKGKKETKTVKVENVQFFNQYVILKLDCFTTPEEAAPYQGCALLVDRENAVKLEEDEYFLADLEGMKVVTEEGIELGVVDRVMPTGANEVLIVRAFGGVFDGVEVPEGEEVLLPSIKECIKRIDPGEGRITVHIMPGLL